MMKRTWAAVVLAAALQGSAARASSIFVEGVITEVWPDGKGYTVKGYDHYNHKRYDDKITSIRVKIAANGVFVLDNRLVRRDMALAVGRWAYAIGSSAGAAVNVALSEPAGRVVGQVADVAAAALALKVVHGLDSYDRQIALAGDVAFRDGGKPAGRDVVLKPGGSVRVAPARRQTVLAFSAKAFEGMIPAGVPMAVAGVVKHAPADGRPTLCVAKGGAVEEFTPDARKLPIVYDVCGDVAHGLAPKPNLAPGCPAVFIAYEKRPGKVDSYLVVQAPDDGRVEGAVKSFDAATGRLVVAAPGPDGPRDVAVTIGADAAIKLDAADAAAAEALKIGHQVSVYAARPQTIETVPAPAPR